MNPARVNAPGQCSNRTSCVNGGNSSTEPCLCDVLLSHASAIGKTMLVLVTD